MGKRLGEADCEEAAPGPEPHVTVGATYLG